MYKHLEIDLDLWNDYVTVCHCWKVDPMENLLSHISIVAGEKRALMEHLQSIARREVEENGGTS